MNSGAFFAAFAVLAVWSSPMNRASGAEGPGTFSVRDVTGGDGHAGQLKVEALHRDHYLLLRGTLENLRRDDRGFMVEYRIPRQDPSATFGTSLDAPTGLAKEENVYPLATMGSVAVAIPPTDPVVFGFAGDKDGLVARLYLGTSPATTRAPNRASFALIVYDVDAKWGFRSALERYYQAFPDFYTARLKPGGLWMFQMGDRVPPNVRQYGFDEIEPQGDPDVVARAIARDRKYGIPMFPYTIVGEREIKELPELPKNYGAAMEAFEHWHPAPHRGVATKEDVSPDAVAHLRDEILSSACQTADHRYALVIRNTTWGANSVTFKIDPNPDLLVGRDTLAAVDGWLAQHPEFAGVYVDSLGANWPATLDYRRDHFAVARRPLTFDAQGRVALQNDLSHYEFLTALRAKLQPSGRMVFGNGIYGYRSRAATRGKPGMVQTFDNQLNEFAAGGAPPEHYRAGTKLGRFFDAALLDVAGSEAGVTATVERCQDARVFMGRKPYAFLNYQWTDGAKVEELVNRSLCFDIFATSTRNFMTKVEYETNPAGYGRDRALIDWFVPLARTLSSAGWQPVTHAATGHAGVLCERYGEGGAVYFTVFNSLAHPQRITWSPDWTALGMDPAKTEVKEIGRNTALPAAAAGNLSLDLAARRTYVLQLRAR